MCLRIENLFLTAENNGRYTRFSLSRWLNIASRRWPRPASSDKVSLIASMGDLAVDRTRATKRNIWLLLTALFTFMSGACAARGDWLLFWVMLALWAFTGILLAVG